MQFELLHQPAYSVARVTLALGESVRAESGAMIAMTPTVEIRAQMGGLGKALGRILARESLFQTTFEAVHGPGEVLLAPTWPGDLVRTEPGPGMMVTAGCFLAGDPALRFETVASMKNFFSGEGLFLMRASGPGSMILSSHGAIHAIQLQANQPYIVDTAHLVAFTEGLGYRVRKAAGGLLNTLKSGEGLVVELTGPGMVYLQTHTTKGLASLVSGGD